MKKWNHYICPKCGGITIARHDDEGVTPFLLRCRARDELHNGIRVMVCKELAQSTFFEGDQSDDQKPHVIFYRPSDAMVAIQAINRDIEEEHRAWFLEHYEKGGALMKENNEQET